MGRRAYFRSSLPQAQGAQSAQMALLSSIGVRQPSSVHRRSTIVNPAWKATNRHVMCSRLVISARRFCGLTTAAQSSPRPWAREKSRRVASAVR